MECSFRRRRGSISRPCVRRHIRKIPIFAAATLSRFVFFTSTWPHRQGAAILPWFASPRGRMPRPRWASAGCSTLPAPARCPRAPIYVNAAPRSTRSLSMSAAAGLQIHPRHNGTRNRSAGNAPSAHFRSPPAAASLPDARCVSFTCLKWSRSMKTIENS